MDMQLVWSYADALSAANLGPAAAQDFQSFMLDGPAGVNDHDREPDQNRICGAGADGGRFSVGARLGGPCPGSSRQLDSSRTYGPPGMVVLPRREIFRGRSFAATPGAGEARRRVCKIIWPGLSWSKTNSTPPSSDSSITDGWQAYGLRPVEHAANGPGRCLVAIASSRRGREELCLGGQCRTSLDQHAPGSGFLLSRVAQSVAEMQAERAKRHRSAKAAGCDREIGWRRLSRIMTQIRATAFPIQTMGRVQTALGHGRMPVLPSEFLPCRRAVDSERVLTKLRAC